MNLSMRWLRQFVDVSVSPKEYAHAMTMSGSKVEGWAVECEDMHKVVIGKVLSVDKHPDADTLVICKIDIGSGDPVQIVTGADNVVPGAIVPTALDGSTLPGGKKIKKGKLRGVESCGMLCSLSELGLTEHDFPYAVEDGIFLIEEEGMVLGTDVRTALGLNDTTVEFEITSNRPDCLSVLGLARETAATFNLPLTVETPTVKGGGGDITKLLQVEIKAPDLCPRYVAKMVKNVKIAPSPLWLRERLRASGVRPINNIVDITNYVMLEYGQPMHAFDHRYVKGGKIVVRNATEGETIKTLDGVDRKLTPDMLVIADEAAPSAIGGVMGGEFSCINDDTTMVVFESANFKGASVRVTARKLGLRTESSGKFEKGLDPENCMPAVLRACQLVELLGAGQVLDGTIDVNNAPLQNRTVAFNPTWINEFLGITATRAEMVSYLEKLGFVVKGDTITVPSCRDDVADKADIAEEVARIYGYDKIPVTTLRGLAQASLSPRQIFERRVHACLLAAGLYEIITYSFISPKYYDKIKMPANSPLRNSVVISNPLGEDTSIMRTTALPSMMEVLARNYNNRNPQAALFEIAMEYYPTTYGQLPTEAPQVMIGLYGPSQDFYTLKGTVETLVSRLGLQNVSFAPESAETAYHPGRCAKLFAGDEEIGILGEIHPAVLEEYDIGTKTYVAKLSADALFRLASHETTYKPLPKFPSSQRDLALLCDDKIPVAQLETAIRGSAGKLLEDLSLFDVYRGAQIADGKKSVAYSLLLRAPDRTLTDDEADNVIRKVLLALEKIGATIRA